MTEFTTEKKTDAAPKRDRAGDQVNQIFKSVFPIQVSGVFSGSGTVTGSGFFSGSGTVTGSGVFSGSGNCYFTALPAGAKVLVQRDGSRGC